MTAPPVIRRIRDLPKPVLLAYAGSVAVGFAVGAYMHWTWWHPVYNVAAWLLEGALLIVGGLLALVPRRIPRRVGLMAVLMGVGMIVGQSLGPSRPPALLGNATMTIRFERPERTVVVVRGTCDYVAGFGQFAIDTGYEGLPVMINNQFAITVRHTRGDMWSSGHEARPDALGLTLDTNPITDPGPLGVRMSSTRASQLVATAEGSSGTLTFSNLVADPRVADQGRPIDFAGSMTWTCTPMRF